MLRRVGRVLRFALVLAGLALLTWLPLSFAYQVGAISPLFDERSTSITVERGAVVFSYLCMDSYTPRLQFAFGRTRGSPFFGGPLLPETLTQSGYDVYSTAISIPLWLLAFICLAWPVTSFILARRRRKGRGFEVEAKPGAAVPPPES